MTCMVTTSATLLVDYRAVRLSGQVMAGVAMIGRRSRRREQPVPGEDFIRGLYTEHGASLLAYTTRLTGDRAAAEDVVQETLLRAWRNRGKLDERTGSIRGWLLTVARNIVTDRARARASRPPEVAEQFDVPSGQPDHADRVADAMTVLGAMDELTEEQRAVLVEVYYRGRSVAETAAALRIPEGTVKSRTYHAVRALRATLGRGEVRR